MGQGQKRGLQDRLVTCSAEEAIGQEERGFIEEEFGLDLAGKDAFVRIIVLAVITPADPHN
jgi:hypothetical protein